MADDALKYEMSLIRTDGEKIGFSITSTSKNPHDSYQYQSSGVFESSDNDGLALLYFFTLHQDLVKFLLNFTSFYLFLQFEKDFRVGKVPKERKRRYYRITFQLPSEKYLKNFKVKLE